MLDIAFFVLSLVSLYLCGGATVLVYQAYVRNKKK